MSEEQWGRAVRVLALAAFGLLAVVVFEARTIRTARAELQTLRDERAGTTAALNALWARESERDIAEALQVADEMFESPDEGLGQPGGVCAGGRLHAADVASSLRVFLAARGRGGSRERALEAVRVAIRSRDDFRALHPDLAAPQ
jgi:hypothetical protein